MKHSHLFKIINIHIQEIESVTSFTDDSDEMDITGAVVEKQTFTMSTGAEVTRDKVKRSGFTASLLADYPD